MWWKCLRNSSSAWYVYKIFFNAIEKSLMKRIGTFIAFFLLAVQGNTQTGPDVQHYSFSIALNDTNDVITCTAEIQGVVLDPGKEISLDLVKLNETTKKGMTVTLVN